MFDAAARLEQLLALVGKVDVHAHGVLLAPVLYHVGKMVDVDDHIAETAGFELLEQMLEERLASDRHKGFGHRIRKGFQTGAEACCKDHCTGWCQHLLYALFAVADMHLDVELLVDVLCKVLGAIDAAVLTARTAEAEHE